MHEIHVHSNVCIRKITNAFINNLLILSNFVSLEQRIIKLLILKKLRGFPIYSLAGVVHLASTESTGGSTTGEDDESSDQQPSLDRVLLETRRNTHQNESIANSYRQAQEKLGFSDDTSTDQNGGGGGLIGAAGSSDGNASAAACSSSLYPPSLPASFPPRLSGKSRGRDKSPSDLEADDENDHDSLNQSETGSTLSLTCTSTTNTTSTSSTTQVEKAKTFLTNSNTPVIRPTTPTGTSLTIQQYV